MGISDNNHSHLTPSRFVPIQGYHLIARGRSAVAPRPPPLCLVSLVASGSFGLCFLSPALRLLFGGHGAQLEGMDPAFLGQFVLQQVVN